MTGTILLLLLFAGAVITGRIINCSAVKMSDRIVTQVGERLRPNRFFCIIRRYIISFEIIRERIRYPGSRINMMLTPPLPQGGEVFVCTDRVPVHRQQLNR